MPYPAQITREIIDREAQVRVIHQATDEVSKGTIRFKAVEFHGIGGLGKSRILDAAKNECRHRQWPFAVIDWLGCDQQEGKASIVSFLLRLCDQLDRYFSLSAARTMVVSMRRRHEFQWADSDYENGSLTSNSDLEDALAVFRSALLSALGEYPLVLMLDSTEHCPDELFDWIGNELLRPLLAVEDTLAVVFLAGRGPKIVESNWDRTLRTASESLRLDPLDFEFTAKHLEQLPPQGRYREAAKDIFALSNGHPHSTEALAHWLNTLGIQVEAVGVERGRMARRLYDEVIHRYVLADGSESLLPLMEVASIPRRFDAEMLSRLVFRFRPQLAPNQPVQWYIARLADLQERPLYYVILGKGKPAYELEPTLRKLLHAALATLNPAETIEMHQELEAIWREALVPPEKPSAAPVVEILYHVAQAAAIDDSDVGLAVGENLAVLLNEYFKPRKTHDLQELSQLKDLLAHDADLIVLVGKGALIDLSSLIDQFLQSPRASTTPFQFSHLVIEHVPPTAYRVSWYRADQVVLPTEIVATARVFSLADWRSKTEAIGKTAFSLYLPQRAQDFVLRQRDWAIQLSTDWTEVPWELLHDGQDFLCLSRPIGRKPKLLIEPRDHEARPEGPWRALVVGNPTGDLPGAEAEARAVAKLLADAEMKVDLLVGPGQATANEFAIRLATQRYDLIHYAGHGDFDPTTPSQSTLAFADGPIFGEELKRSLKARSFVFLSTCMAAMSTSQDSKFGFQGRFIEGLAISVLLGGAVGCLGPIWRIEDSVASDFAIEFYRQLLSEQPAGEAVRQARLAVRDRSPDFWASWVLYGDPLQTMF